MLPIIETLTEQFQDILQDKLVGLYLHGSLCLGGFQWQTSDIDLIAVTSCHLEDSLKIKIVDMLLAHQQEYPAKGVEFSLLHLKDCQAFSYPTPYLLHFSNYYYQEAKKDIRAFVEKMHGTDKDLAAHLTILQKKGIKLCGQEIAETFSPVPKADYFDSILSDLQDAPKNIYQQPVYYILNFARTYAYLKEDLILSKEEGGLWAVQQRVADWPLILKALQANHGQNITFGKQELNHFCQIYLCSIKQAFH